jgi:hypothetical protein
MNSGFKLQAWTIVINSLKATWRDKKVFFNTISLPCLLLVLCYALSLEFAKNIGVPVMILIVGMLAVGLCWLAIICHRLILVRDFNVYKEFDFRMLVRATKFLVMIFQAFAVIWLIDTMITIIISNIFKKNEIRQKL